MSIVPAPETFDSPVFSMADCILQNDRIDIWILPALDWDSTAARLQQEALLQLLSTDEIDRASRFHFARDAAEFIANRGRLRTLLACYVDASPASLRFAYSPTGKPSLDLKQGEISFNLSHTEGLAAVAVTRHRRVGIDIERGRPANSTHRSNTPPGDELEIARLYFSPLEVQSVERYEDEADQQAAFFRCWTRKEAFLKGLGDGLNRPLTDFSVSCDPDKAELLHCDWDAAASSTWQLANLDLDEDYTAALAYEGGLLCMDDQIQTQSWPKGGWRP